MLDLFQVATLGALALGAVVMFFIGALAAHLVYSVSDLVNAKRRVGAQSDT
jgi:hypothetical protein